MAWLAAVSFELPVAAQGTGPIIETFAGGGGGDAVRYLTPSPIPASYGPGLAVDGSGNVYIADSSSGRILKVGPTGSISTIASMLWYPMGLAVDSSGNVYVAERNNHRIHRVDSSGTISTFAGTGTAGFGGDGGSATSSMLQYPGGVAVDGSGNVYIADTDNHRIRRVDSSGTISTFAGTGTAGFGGDGGSATSSMFRSPQRVAVDGSGNVYIADVGNRRIRKVDTSGTISTIAGTGVTGFGGDGGQATSALFAFPRWLAVDGSGNVYIADTFNHRIRRVDSSGAISTVLAAPLIYQPRSVAVDGSGNVYVGEFSGVLRLDALTNDLSMLATVGRSYGFGLDGVSAASSLLANPGMWRRTVRAMSTSPILTGAAFARWTHRGSSRHSRAPAPQVSAATADRQLRRLYITMKEWRWTVPATSTSPTLPTTASAR